MVGAVQLDTLEARLAAIVEDWQRCLSAQLAEHDAHACQRWQVCDL